MRKGDYKDFDYKGSVEIYTIETNGIYKLETWGAQGGTATITAGSWNPISGAKGGYARGYLKLKKGQVIKANVGGMGESSLGTHKSGDSGYGGSGGYNGGRAGGHNDANDRGAAYCGAMGGSGGKTDLYTGEVLRLTGYGGQGAGNGNMGWNSRTGSNYTDSTIAFQGDNPTILDGQRSGNGLARLTCVKTLSFKLGDNDVEAMYLGDLEIDAFYLGDIEL